MGATLIELLQNLLVVASFIAILYTPFHYLDQYATPGARARAMSAIRTGLSNTDTTPLTSLMDAVFGHRHLTLRCFALSSILSLVFTMLFVAVSNKYLLEFKTYIAEYNARVTAAEKPFREAMEGLSGVLDDMIADLEKADKGDLTKQLQDLRRQKVEAERLRNTSFAKGDIRLFLWMFLSVAISMNLLCDYVALGKTRIILKRIAAAKSPFAVGGYLVIDLLMAVVIWAAAVAIFLYINTAQFLSWSKETPALVATVGTVSLACTIATSIWIYTFLAGTYGWRFVRLLLRGTTGLVDPERHTFKVIGIVGSVTLVVLLAASFIVIKLGS